MGYDLSLAERDSVRAPMPWSREPQAGFSTARKTVQPGHQSRAIRLRADKCRIAAARSKFIAELDGADDPAPERMPGSRLGELGDSETGSPAVLAMRYDW